MVVLLCRNGTQVTTDAGILLASPLVYQDEVDGAHSCLGYAPGVHDVTKRALQVELAPIQQLLPEEMLALVLSHLPTAYDLGAVACTCRGWRTSAHNPALWRGACARTFQELQPDALARLVRLNHRCDVRSLGPLVCTFGRWGTCDERYGSEAKKGERFSSTSCAVARRLARTFQEHSLTRWRGLSV